VIAGLVLGRAAPVAAVAQQRTLYSSVDEDQAKALIKGFETKHPEVQVKAIPGPTAPIIARIIAEAANPQAGIMMGNAVSALMSADSRGLLLSCKLSCKPANDDKVSPLMRDARPEPIWVGIDAWRAPVCFNAAEGAKKTIPAPTTWIDLTKPTYKGQMTMPSPLSSGTAFLALQSGSSPRPQARSRITTALAKAMCSGARLPCQPLSPARHRRSLNPARCDCPAPRELSANRNRPSRTEPAPKASRRCPNFWSCGWDECWSRCG
jgi:hypothetical protein